MAAAVRLMAAGEAPANVRLMTGEQIAERYFGGNVTREWVLAHVPGKRKYGHRTVLWFEHEVREWVLQHGR